MATTIDSVKSGIANAADKLAQAETVDEARDWQSIITNLTSTLQIIQRSEESNDQGDVKEDGK